MVNRSQKTKEVALQSACNLTADLPSGETNVILIIILKVIDHVLYFLKLFQACKDATILHLIPALLPPTVLMSGKKKAWKPTIAESQEAFISHVKVFEILDVHFS